jgi:hypothetical protein
LQHFKHLLRRNTPVFGFGQENLLFCGKYTGDTTHKHAC